MFLSIGCGPLCSFLSSLIDVFSGLSLKRGQRVLSERQLVRILHPPRIVEFLTVLARYRQENSYWVDSSNIFRRRLVTFC
jgi:hypothetical protein